MIRDSEDVKLRPSEETIGKLAVVFVVWIMILITGVAAAVIWVLMV